MSQLQRVIFNLADGRRKYATHNGEMLAWDDDDLSSLNANIDEYGMPVFTADFQQFDFNHALLRERFPKAKIVRVKSIDTESYYSPLNPNVIF